jgi:hypothetical protein
MSTLRSAACLGTPGRTIYLLLGAALTAFALVEMIRFGGATWFALAFFILPDVALMYGADRNRAPGQLHPRAVRFYNIVHSFWIPLVLMLAGLWLPPLVFTAGAAWAAHIAWDRGLGFGLRTRKGFQQLPVCPRA